MTRLRDRPDPEYEFKEGVLFVYNMTRGLRVGTSWTRVNPQAFKRMQEIDSMTDVNEALEAIIDLYFNYTRFEEIDLPKADQDTVYDEATMESKWTRCSDGSPFPGNFYQEFQIDGNNPDYGYYCRPCLSIEVIAQLKQKPQTVKTSHGTFEFNYEKRSPVLLKYWTEHILFKEVK